MVNYLLTLITTFLILHQSTLLCKNTIYPECKRLWVSFLWSILVPKCGMIFLKNWNLSRPIHLENQIKAPCYLAKITVDFRFIYLSLLCNIVLMPLFSLIYYTSSLLLLTPPPYTMACVSPPVFCYCFVCLFHSMLIRCVLSLSFTTSETSSFENWFVLATGPAEQLIQTAFRQRFVIRAC